MSFPCNPKPNNQDTGVPMLIIAAVVSIISVELKKELLHQLLNHLLDH
jgi:hypothetical protein